MIVPGMDESDTRTLLAGRRDGGVSVDLSERVHQATGGNPLAILELASDLSVLHSDSPVPVPAALAESFLRRADALGPGPPTLLALAAAAGGDLRVVVRAGTVLGIDPWGLAALESAGLVSTTTDRVVFTHPMVGSAIHSSLAAPARRAVHAAIVDALPDADLERRAWHRAAAALGPDEGAARAVESVATASRRCGAYAVAAAGFERSAALTEDDPGRAVRLVDGASAAWKAGDGEWSLRLIEMLERLDPVPAVRTRALALRGGLAARVGSLEEARELLLRAASESAGSDPEEAIRLVAEAVNASFYLADGALAFEAAQLGERLLETEVDGASAALGHLAVGMARVLDGRDGADHIREGVRLFSLVAADPQTALDSTWVVLGLLWLRESGATRASLQAVEAARAETAVGALPRLLFHLARDGATTDRWVSAACEYLESIALAEEFGHETDEATSLAGLAWLEARQGLEEDCRRHAQRAVTVAVPRHINIACIWARFALGELDLASGRMKEAVEGLIDLHAWLDAVGIRDVDVSPAPELV